MSATNKGNTSPAPAPKSAAPQPPASTATATTGQNAPLIRRANNNNNLQMKKCILKIVSSVIVLSIVFIIVYFASDGFSSNSTIHYYPNSSNEPEPEPIIEESKGEDSISQQSRLSKLLPQNFDITSSLDAEKCDFSVQKEDICSGKNWSSIITSTISNTICLGVQYPSTEYPSNSYLFNCDENPNKCETVSSLEDINVILSLARKGIPSKECISDATIETIAEYQCQNICDDGSKLKLNQYSFENLTNGEGDAGEKTIENVRLHLYLTGPVIAVIENETLEQNNLSENDDNVVELKPFKVIGWEIVSSDSEQTVNWIIQNTTSSEESANENKKLSAKDLRIKALLGLEFQNATSEQ